MTSNDPMITAILDQLAAYREQLTQLDAREAEHHAAVTAQLTGLTAKPSQDPGGYQPEAAPPWWQLSPDGRREPTRPAARLGRAGLPARLRAPRRHPRPLLGLPRPVPVRPGRAVPACGRCSISSRSAPPGCCPPRPNTRPASCPPWPPSWPPKPPVVATPPPGACHDRQPCPPPGPRLRRPRLAGIPLPARTENPRHQARIPRRHHRSSSRSPTGSTATPAGTWPSPPAPPDPTSWTSTSTGPPGTGSPPWAGCAAPGCWTARPPTCAPPAAACTPTSPAPPSATATCPRTTWTSARQAATSSPRPPR